MRREGVLTGYLSFRSKVKVKGKPTNASKASGRCGRAKCPKCHEQPVSKAKSKSKGRNKRALSRVLVDDEWAFARAPARRIKAVLSVPSHVDHDYDYTYDALDACHADAELSGHDVDDYAYYVRCRADAKLMHLDVNDNAANTDHDIKEAHDVSASNDVDYAMPALQDFMCPDRVTFADDLKKVALDVNPGICANADDVINDDDDYTNDVLDVCHAEDASTVMFPLTVFALDGSLHTVMHACQVMGVNNPVKKVAPDVNPGICAKANDAIIDNDDEDGDVNHGCHTMMAHAEDDVALEEEEDDDTNSNKGGHAMIMHAADDVSSDDDDVCDDDAANDFQSLISGLGKVESPSHDDNEKVSDAESEENSLSGDWYHVSSSEIIDDEWYLC